MLNITGLGHQNHNKINNQKKVSFQGNNGTFVSPSALNTDAVYTTWNNPNASQADATLTLLHINDNHRKIKGMSKFKTAFDEIAAKVKTAGSDLLAAHSGDYNVGTDAEKLKLQVKMLNELGVNFSAVGNHEFDIHTPNLAKALNEAKYVSLAANLTIPETSDLHKIVQAGKLLNTSVYESNGNKYGVIGLSPTDLIERSDPKTNFQGVGVLDTEKTVAKVQEEVNKFKAQGINKIVLVSHIGLDIDQKIARETDGIDIILGGHSHDLVNPLEPGVSLLNSKSNEPVLIFQNGKDASFFGVTDAQFDKNGVIKSAVARQENAENFDPNAKIDKIEEEILGSSPVIGISAGKHTASDIKTKEKAIGNFIADAVKDKTGADMVLLQSFAVRDTINKGEIKDRDIDEVLPFVDAVHKLQITGQDVVDALSVGAHTLITKNVRPGILQVSGLKYTISPEGKAVDVVVQQKDGSYLPIDPAKEYNVACDQFLVKGSEGFKTLAQPTKVVKSYFEDNADVLKEYIKKFNLQPIEMKEENRINILAKDPTSNGNKPKGLQKAEVPYIKTINQAAAQVQPKANQEVRQPVAAPAGYNAAPNMAYQMPVNYMTQPMPMVYYPPNPFMVQIPPNYYYGQQ